MKPRYSLTLDRHALAPAGAVATLLSLAALTPVMAANAYWANPASGAWETPTNWAGDFRPAIGDVAYITNGGEAIIATEDTDVNSLVMVDGSLTLTGGSLNLKTTADVFTIGTNYILPQTPGATGSSVNGTADITLSNDSELTGVGKLFFGVGFSGGDYPTGPNLTTTNITLSDTASIRGSTVAANANYLVFGAGGATVNLTLHDSAYVAKAVGFSGELFFGDGSGNLTTLANVTVNAHETSSIRSSNGVWLANRTGAIATVTLHDSASIQTTTTNAGHLIVGVDGGTGVLNVTEDSYFTVNDALAVGFSTIPNGTAANGSSGTLTYSSTGISSSRTAFNVGYGNNAHGTVTMSAGRINTSQVNGNSFWGGGNPNATAALTFSGDSQVASASALTIAADGSSATVALSGTADVAFTGTNPKAWFYGAGGNSSVTMSGNSKFAVSNSYIKSGDFSSLGSYAISLEDSAALSIAGRITIGHWGGNTASTATVTIADSASFTANDYITIGKDDSSGNGGMNAQVRLDGGTLATKYIASGGGTTSATNNTVVGNGGTIKALDAGDFFRTTPHNANRTHVEIEAAGLKFDTNGFDVAAGNNFSEDPVSTGGGLTKIGNGTLFLNGATYYPAATTVAAGALGGTGYVVGSIVVQDDAALSPGAPTGSMLVDGNVTFQEGSAFIVQIDDSQDSPNGSIDMIGTLDVRGAALQVNVTGPVGSGPYTIASGGTVTGPFASVPDGVEVNYDTTSITITPPSTAGSFSSWATINGVTGGTDGDSDNDGIKNLVEYALDLDPGASDGAPGTFAAGAISFTKRDLAVTNGDVSYTIQISDSLATDSWQNILPGDVNLTETDEGISYTLPTTGPKLFARLMVTQNLPM